MSETGSIAMDSVSGDCEPVVPRGRSYSTGTMPASLSLSRQRKAATGASGRLRGKLEASVAGLEELAILREKQRALVERAKGMAGRRGTPGETPSPDTSFPTSQNKLSDKSKISESRGSPCPGDSRTTLYEPILEQGEENISPEIRPRSASFTVGQRPSINRRRLSMQKSSPLVECSSKQNLTETQNKMKDKVSDANNNESEDGNDSGLSVSLNDSMETTSTKLEDNVLTNYTSDYTKPTTLSGSNVTYHFPSPMHAVLLRYKDTVKDNADNKENDSDPDKNENDNESDKSSTSSEETKYDVSRIENHADRIAALALQRRRFSADERMLRMKNILKDISISNPKITQQLSRKASFGSAPQSPKSPQAKHGKFFAEGVDVASSPHSPVILSARGSRTSLNSEEGYFSNPGSPKARRGHKLSNCSFSSNGSSLSPLEDNIEEEAEEIKVETKEVKEVTKMETEKQEPSVNEPDDKCDNDTSEDHEDTDKSKVNSDVSQKDTEDNTNSDNENHVPNITQVVDTQTSPHSDEDSDDNLKSTSSSEDAQKQSKPIISGIMNMCNSQYRQRRSSLPTIRSLPLSTLNKRASISVMSDDDDFGFKTHLTGSISNLTNNSDLNVDQEPMRRRSSSMMACTSVRPKPKPAGLVREKQNMSKPGPMMGRRHSFSPGHTAISSGSYIKQESIYYMRTSMSSMQDTLI